MIREFIKSLVPPLFLRLLRRIRHGTPAQSITFFPYTGPDGWQGAARNFGGYDARLILEKCRDALLKVKRGEVAYERDSVTFYQVEYSWPLLSALLWAAAEHGGELDVLDFGGSLGSSWFQNRRVLATLRSVRWNVVEQPLFVECGRQYFEDQTLRFFESVDECLAIVRPSIFVASSVLPYLENPRQFVSEIVHRGFTHICIDRTYFVRDTADILAIQVIPPEIYAARYPAWFLNEESFVKLFEEHYDLVAAFDSYLSVTDSIAGHPAFERGMIFRKKATA